MKLSSFYELFDHEIARIIRVGKSGTKTLCQESLVLRFGSNGMNGSGIRGGRWLYE